MNESSKKLDLSKIPLPVTAKSPIRLSIRGVTHLIPELKAFVAKQSFDASLKAFVDAELGKITTNAATIHLHDVTRLDGGFDLHLTISAVQLGAAPDSVVTTE